MVKIKDGSWWFPTNHGSGDWSGRCASLLAVTWIEGWPIIGNRMWSGRKPIQGMKDSASGRRIFQPIGEDFRMKWFAYRGDSIGLFSYNPLQEAGRADFDWLHNSYSDHAAPSTKPHRSK